MKKIVLIVTALTLTTAIKAQNSFTLAQAMRYAVENNSDVKIQEEANASTQQEKIQATASLFPSLSASSSLYNSYGRSIDPETNTYTTVGNVSNSYSVSSYLTVFSGLTKINALRSAKLKSQMGDHSLQQAKDAAALSVMQLFFDALYYGQSVTIVEQQKEAAERVLTLSRKQEELGIKSAADVALSLSQVASYDLILTQQSGLYSQALLSLKEAMNFPFEQDITLIAESTPQEIPSTESFDIEANPEYQIAQRQLKISQMNLKIARGNYLPTLTFGAGYNNYYYASLADGYIPTPFADQIKTNYGYYVGASLSIPIFSSLSYRTSVARSRHSLRTAELQLHKTELQVSKAAHEALLSRDNSHKEQISAKAKKEACEAAHGAMLRKFEQGVASIIELQTTANELLQASAEDLRARLNYQIKSQMVEYYSGKELINE
ncbi:MAG: TolC family protein [Rikenellaceae bacterium]